MKLPFFSAPRRPANEAERQAAVDSYDFSHLPDELLNDLLGEAAELLGVPIAAITIIDDDTQRVVAGHALQPTEMPRAISFCGHAIGEDAPDFVVSDAAQDARFAGNPLVTGGLRIGFYAGTALKDESGHTIGMLCTIDTAPHPEPSEDVKDKLRALSRRAMERLGRMRRDRLNPAD